MESLVLLVELHLLLLCGLFYAIFSVMAVAGCPFSGGISFRDAHLEGLGLAAYYDDGVSRSEIFRVSVE